MGKNNFSFEDVVGITQLVLLHLKWFGVIKWSWVYVLLPFELVGAYLLLWGILELSDWIDYKLYMKQIRKKQ